MDTNALLETAPSSMHTSATSGLLKLRYYIQFLMHISTSMEYLNDKNKAKRVAKIQLMKGLVSILDTFEHQTPVIGKRKNMFLDRNTILHEINRNRKMLQILYTKSQYDKGDTVTDQRHKIIFQRHVKERVKTANISALG